MPRLLVHIEGQTEENFVNEILRDYLVSRGYSDVRARILGNPRQRGGICSWPSAKREIVRHLKSDRDCVATTMVDYYGLPHTGGRAWPGRAIASTRPMQEKASTVENALLEDIQREMGHLFNPVRFVPFVVMHEFEGLLFSDCAAFSRGIGQAALETAFSRIRSEFANPEEINDSPDTAPSKRVKDLVPGYEKPLFGALATLEIGLASIRRECPHFNDWLDRLEAILA